jgi:hypothetical protein
MYAFVRTLRNAHHVRRYTIRIIDTGWEVRAEQDSVPIHSRQFDDWHRVERAQRSMIEELEALRRSGWTEEAA